MGHTANNLMKTIKLTTRPSTKFLKFQKMPPRTISRNSTGNSQKSTTLIDPTAMPKNSKKYQRPMRPFLTQKNAESTTNSAPRDPLLTAQTFSICSSAVLEEVKEAAHLRKPRLSLSNVPLKSLSSSVTTENS